jgi:hypothetical protein
MKWWHLLLPLLLVLAGCSDTTANDSANVEAASVTTTTIAAAQPAGTAPSPTVAPSTGTAVGARCQGTVAFPPTADDVATDIVAYRIACTDALDVVRHVGGPLGPGNGLAQADADGFTCLRTSQQVGHDFPWATYDCTRGTDRITFSRYSTTT